MKSLLVSCMLLLAFVASGCATNQTPQTVAANTAHNGTILVESVDEVQKFVITQEAAGVIPRNVAVTTMEGIGQGLTAARSTRAYLEQLAVLAPGDAKTSVLINQIQDSLALVNSNVVGIVVPGASEPVRGQIAALVANVNKAISVIREQVAKVKGAQ